ncbi:MAG TPA: hypothetical protein VHX36_10090 [Candidatus Acidoferrales bacterium]|jgi:hypothetical protein|nr:hypothetical protein [Candidatus Acidoferrales bacterium]
MKLLDWASKLTRRGFLASGATTIAAAAVAGKALLADAPAAGAAEPVGLTEEQSRALLRFNRDLFPHDRLPDAAYEKAIAPLLAEAASDPATRQLLAQGIAQLDASTSAAVGMAYVHVADETVRVAAIQKIQAGAFFAKVYGDTITPLYNQPEMWAKFGYQGPSSAFGGYLHRGFNDLDWL